MDHILSILREYRIPNTSSSFYAINNIKPCTVRCMWYDAAHRFNENTGDKKMPFREPVKNEVLVKAAYSCCVCQKPSVSVEVHHLIPQENGGPDTIDNAAPLCPNHHSDLGANPRKQKRIRQMRDYWYDFVAKLSSSNPDISILLPEMRSMVTNIREKQDDHHQIEMDKLEDQQKEMDNLKVLLKQVANKTIDDMTSENSDYTAFSVLSTAVSSIQQVSSFLGDLTFNCTNCNKPIDANTISCPHCGIFFPTMPPSGG